MVGDNLKTDIAGGIRAGLKTALIFTGISVPSDVEQLDIEPDFQVHDYDELTSLIWQTKRSGQG